MKKWVLKAVIQKGISYLPYKEHVNFFFQKYVTRGVELTDTHFGWKLEAARDHILYYRQFGQVDPPQATVLELGTGWYPIVPTLLYLAGFAQTVSVDIRSWMTTERNRVAFRKILEYHDSGRLQAFVPEIDPARLANLRRICNDHSADLDQLNREIHLDARVMDATVLDFPDGTFDLICSNNTFEHVYAEVLRNILREFKRVLKPDGVMSHFIDLSDHFAHLDPTITIYNFLRFSRKEWSAIDNSIQPQNRLRWPDYRSMYSDLEIPVRLESVRPGSVEELQRVPVHGEFSQYAPEALAISHGYLIS